MRWLNLQFPLDRSRDLNILIKIAGERKRTNLEKLSPIDWSSKISFPRSSNILFFQGRIAGTAVTGTGNREDPERISLWNNWPSWKDCSTRLIIPTRSWGRNLARDSVWARPGFKFGSRTGVPSVASTRANCTKVTRFHHSFLPSKQFIELQLFPSKNNIYTII